LISDFCFLSFLAVSKSPSFFGQEAAAKVAIFRIYPLADRWLTAG